MTRRRLLLIVGTFLGAGLLPGCLRPFARPSECPEPIAIQETKTFQAKVPLPVPSPVEPDQLEAAISRGIIERTTNPDREMDMPATTPGQLGPVLPAPPFPAQAKNTSSEQEEEPVKSNSPIMEEPLLKALRCVLENHHYQALDYLKSYDATTQNFFICLLPTMARLTEKPLENLSPEEMSVIQGQLEGLLDTIRPRTELVITKMCFCQSITAFGIYEPLPEDHLFRAATPNCPGEPVKVYVELRNFSSARRDPYHETRLSSSVEIRDPRDPDLKKPALWYYRFDDNKQPVRSRAQLHDYNNKYTFQVPHIPPGVYTLTIQVVDETCPERRRVVKKSLEFRVTAMPP